MIRAEQFYKGDLQQIIDALLTQNGEASLQNLLYLLPSFSKRTLLRRINLLIESGQVTISGNTRNIKYRLISTATANTQQPQRVAAEEETINNEIPLSPAAKALFNQVSLPPEQRTPASFNRNFLDKYVPNKTSYLSDAEQRELATLGRIDTPPTEQAGTYTKELYSRLIIDLSWNSSRLEGNTYSLLDTQRLLQQGQAAENKSVTDAQMILNHKEAIEFILQTGDDIGFNPFTIKNLHAILSSNLLPDPSAPGRLRRHPVSIGKSVYTPVAIPALVEEMFDLVLKKAAQINNPFEQALFAMIHLPYLQPFDDVNKRVSRLAANISFNRTHLSPLSFVEVPGDIYIKSLLAVYELNDVQLLKEVFVWAYKRSADRYSAIRQLVGEPDPFKLQHRDKIKALIQTIIVQRKATKDAQELITTAANDFSESTRQKFIEVVETELMSLHEGNFARYQVTPGQYKKWKAVWN